MVVQLLPGACECFMNGTIWYCVQCWCQRFNIIYVKYYESVAPGLYVCRGPSLLALTYVARMTIWHAVFKSYFCAASNILKTMWDNMCIVCVVPVVQENKMCWEFSHWGMVYFTCLVEITVFAVRQTLSCQQLDRVKSMTSLASCQRIMSVSSCLQGSCWLTSSHLVPGVFISIGNIKNWC